MFGHIEQLLPLPPAPTPMYQILLLKIARSDYLFYVFYFIMGIVGGSDL